MTTLREILQYVADQPARIAPFPRLKANFRGDLTGLSVALARGHLDLRGDCYSITEVGLAFLSSAVIEPVTEKVCYECKATRPAAEFWKNASSGDGLFDDCIPCATRKKRAAMEKRQADAIFAIAGTAENLVKYAEQWDYAVAMLADAWRGIMEADEVIRLHGQVLGNENDSGRMHARLTFPRAAFGLNLALMEARFPQVLPVLREAGFPEKLVDYIGPDPAADYLKGGGIEGSTPEAPIVVERNSKEVNGSGSEEGHAAPERGEGQEAGHAEQGDARAKGNDPRRAGGGGRAGVPRQEGKVGKARGVSPPRRRVLAS